MWIDVVGCIRLTPTTRRQNGHPFQDLGPAQQMGYVPKNFVLQQPEGKESPLRSSPFLIHSSSHLPRHLSACVAHPLLADELAGEEEATVTELAGRRCGSDLVGAHEQAHWELRRDRTEELRLPSRG